MRQPNLAWFLPGLLPAVLAFIPAGAAGGRQPPGWPQTRAERTGYRETSSYDDVFGFLMALREKGAPVEIRIMGTLPSGRRMALVVATRVPNASSLERARLRERGIPVVYLQANIHGGEVEGKEALLMLLRQLATDDREGLLGRMVLLVDPIYNIDGNEKLGPGPENRPSQDGPDPVGQRANGGGLDLNRDCMKAESPEMRALLASVYTPWDPDLVMDLHTTDGTRHGFQLTYSPPLNPDTEAGILAYSRDELLPAVRRRMREKYGLQLFDYGNVEGRGAERAWVTFGQEPRYVTNYVGLRSRIGILSEAASFLPFKARVEATLRFVETILGEVARQGQRVTGLARRADERVTGWGRKPETAPPGGVRFAPARRGEEPIPLEVLVPGAPVDRRKAPAMLEEVVLPVVDRFRAERTAKFPAAYLIPARHAAVVELLRRHGIAVERLTQPWQGEIETFDIQQLEAAATPFQGHRLKRLEGKFRTGKGGGAAGDYLVRTAQPLGMLCFHLLEPESLDGAAAWGFFREALAAGAPYPVLKAAAAPGASTERAP